jgi:AcrR family transcriptional regulator
MARLLDAAVEVFASRGYHAARVDDIVRAAKTSHGTFYLYFANKEDLLRALTEHVAEELAALVESLRSINGGVRGRRALTEWLDHFAELYDHYGPVIRTWTEAETGDTTLGQLGEEMFGRISGALARRIAESSASGIDPDVAALALLAMAERFNYYAVSGQVVADRAELVAVLGQISHSALFGQGPGRAPRISKEH